MTDSESAAIIAFFSTYAVLVIALCVLYIIAMWKIFTKAGEEGWKSLIPVYNMHIFARISWKASYFWYSVLAAAALYLIGTAVRGSTGGILMICACIVELVYGIKSMIHLSKRFGKSTGFTVLLILVNSICMLILGFGSADYQLSRDPD